MKIGLLGAPGTGKTGVASKLASAYSKEYGSKPKIIDKYVDRLIDRTGYAFGIHGTYPQQLQILFERWTLEQEARHKGFETTITCGTLYETILYSAIRANNDAVLHKEDIELQVTARAAMQALGMIEKFISDYDLLFFLPYDGKKLMEKGKSYDTVVDAKLPEVVAGYFKQLIPLTGTDKDKVKGALKTIRSYAEWKAEASLADGQAEPGSQGAPEAEPQTV